MTQEVWQGGCVCGQVRFEVTGELAGVIGCHCRQCRRMSGHFFAATAVPHTNLLFTRNQGLAWYAASKTSRRGFCRNCGSSLFFDHGSNEPIGIAAGAFDGNPPLRMAAHIYTDEGGGYYEVPADAPGYDGASWRKGGWRAHRQATKG